MNISRMAVGIACVTTLLGGMGGSVAMADTVEPSPAPTVGLPSPTTGVPSAVSEACGRVGVLCFQDYDRGGRVGRVSQDNDYWSNLEGWDWENKADWFYNNNTKAQVSVASLPKRKGTHFTLSYGQTADKKYQNFGQSNWWRG